MMNNVEPICDGLLAYVAGEGDRTFREQFERHLAVCDECRRELADLMPVWQSLPYTAEMQEPPLDLKRQVMGSIFGDAADIPRTLETAARLQPKRLGRQAGLWGTAAAALIAGLVIGLGWGWKAKPPTAPPEAILNEPIQVVNRLALSAADPNIPAAGVVTITRQGERYALLVQTSGLPENRQQEAYQVWLIKDGKRSNAGTFRVDTQGNGALTFPAGEAPPAFDTIGITLEPDAQGSQPRGKKILGT